MDRELDVFTNYRNINNKIKKRFLKKPNFGEASEQYATLTRFLKQQECPQYAGFCCLAKARCENALANPVAEAESLLEAARLFFDAEWSAIQVKCPSLEEHLSEAIHCYNQALKAYQKEGNLSLAARVSLELANKLMDIDKTEEAYNHYVRASHLQKQFSVLDYLDTLKNAAYCKLRHSHNYAVALNHLGEVANTIESLITANKACLTHSVAHLMQTVEITRVFTLLLLKSFPIDLNGDHSKVMERYTWESNDNNRVLTEKIFLLVQSVVMAAQAGDGEILREMESELFEYLDPVQCELLHRVVQEVNN